MSSKQQHRGEAEPETNHRFDSIDGDCAAAETVDTVAIAVGQQVLLLVLQNQAGSAGHHPAREDVVTQGPGGRADAMAADGDPGIGDTA